MRYTPLLIILSLSLVTARGCAAMMAAQRENVQKSLSFAPGVDPAPYGRLAITDLSCGGPLCQPEHLIQFNDGAAMALSRVGYDVYDRMQFEELMAQSFQAVTVTETQTTRTRGGGGGISITMDADDFGGGIGVSAIDPNTGEEIQVGVGAGVGGAHAHASSHRGRTITTTTTTRGPMIYGELPAAERAWVLAESGISGVTTGRIFVSEPDDVTGFVTVRTFVRLSDAQTGQLVWQFDWDETAFDGLAEVPEAIERATVNLEEAHRMHLGMPTRTF